MTHQRKTIRLNPGSVPSAGMRGGLGRTLLTSFLLLSILPLSLISFVAAAQARGSLEEVLKEKLTTIATLTEAQIHHWVTNQDQVLWILAADLSSDLLGHEVNLLAQRPDSPIASGSSTEATGRDSAASTGGIRRSLEQTAALHADAPFLAVLLVDEKGHVLDAQPMSLVNRTFPELTTQQPALLEGDSSIVRELSSALTKPASSAIILTKRLSSSALRLVALLDPEGLTTTLHEPLKEGQSSDVYLVPRSGRALKLTSNNLDVSVADHGSGSEQMKDFRSAGIEAAMSGLSGTSSYQNHDGTAVIGAYRWLPQLNLAMLIEQPKRTALEASDDLAVVLIAATLGMVLLTALIAALVTRRITMPIVELTATAVQIAAGNLDQKVPATRRDEIGILARAFNVMTTKLRLVYEDLEYKVKERTEQLESANAEIRYQAMQLAVSAEVGRIVTSILDKDVLPKKVVELIRDCFQTYFVAIYFLDEEGVFVTLQEATGGLGAQLKSSAHKVELRKNELITQAVNRREARMSAGSSLDRCINRQVFPHTRAELAIPLNIGDRTIGVLDVHSTHEDAFDGNELVVLETLSRQIVVALENARVYEIEREAAEQLRELSELRQQFLANMSRELRMPLNNIIGFSRVMLKEIDGPITKLQRDDLHAIHDSGQQLLSLINDILDIAQIEAGAMELSVQPVEFSELVQSVTPTANALLQDRPIEFRCDIGPDVPPVLADANRLRQVLVKLLSNAAKFTEEGTITLIARRNGDHIMSSVIDTGVGVPDNDREKIFEMFRQVSEPVNSSSGGTGLGLAFSREIVEMHGGRIWLEGNKPKGTIFTFTLPIAQQGEGHPSPT
jgi:signal transduction histidine kinase